MFFIASRGTIEGESGTEAALRRAVRHLRLLVLVDTAGVDAMVPGGRVIESIGADLSRIPAVIDLACPRCMAAIALKELRQGNHLGNAGAEMFLQVINAGGIGRQAGEQGSPRRAAQRQLTIGAVKANAGAREAIEVRRPRQPFPTGAEGMVQIIRGDKQHVALRAALCGQRPGQTAQ